MDGTGKEHIEIGYTMNGTDLGVAFRLSATSQDLSRYFPAVNLNLEEFFGVQFGSSTANTES